jgi:hypothetical protein
MRFFALLFIATSCVTKTPKVAQDPVPVPNFHISKCPDSIVVKDNAPAWNDYDQGMVKNMNDGCRRHYSPKHCAKKIVKTSDKEYAITCGLRISE